MRIGNGLALLLLTLMVVACSGIETRPSDTAAFAAGNYKYYKWRSEPLQNTANSTDPAYLMDPILRREVDANLAAKGYILDSERAQFSVDYIYASGLRFAERDVQGSSVTAYPSVTANRQINQAEVDNKYALGGVKETSNIALQFNDVQRRQQVWQVVITRIVENVNEVDVKDLKNNLPKGVRKALDPLPQAP